MTKNELSIVSRKLKPQQLYQACDPAQFVFQTTAELAPLGELIGQMRAFDAVRFGAGIRHEGFNIFVLGPAGVGKRSMVSQLLGQKASAEPASDDWCYVNNFEHPHKPQAMRLPCGRGTDLQQQLGQRVAYLRTAIPALFESEDYRAKAEAIQQAFSTRQESAFKELGEAAGRQHIVLLRTPGGFAFAPTRADEVMAPEEYNKLPDDEKQRVADAIEELQKQLEKILAHIPQWMKERGDQLRQLNRETSGAVVTRWSTSCATGSTTCPRPGPTWTSCSRT